MTQLQDARLKLKELSNFDNLLNQKSILLIKEDENIKIPLTRFWDTKTIPGLSMKHVPEYKNGTMFLCLANKDCFIEKHLHTQQETIILIEGNFKETETNTVLSEKGSTLTIKPNQLHGCQISKGSIFHVIFKPTL